MDLNAEALAYAGRRIARYRPETHLGNVLQPIAWEGERFDSVGINYLLHCLPGSMSTKANAFEHLAALMNPGAVLFGSTLLGQGVPRNWMARRLMDFYNRKGIFSNQADDLPSLRRALEERFTNATVKIVGCAALFAARR